MADLISRQAAIDEHRLKNEIYKFVDKYGQIKMSITQFNILLEQNRVEMIKDAPTIEPERKKGKWLNIDGCAYCSACRCNYKKAIMTHANFCPNCGADMRGVEEK